MTEEEKSRLRKAKREAGERLNAVPLSAYRLSDTDPRLEEYARAVIAHPESHNLWEQLALERFFRMIDRYGLDAREIQRFFFFYEYLYFPGKTGMQRYRLTPVQAFQFASVYGFWKTSPAGKRLRIVHTCVLYVPRKFSKTTSSAAFALYDLLYGDNNSESYIGANSQDQAKKCFEVIRGCLFRLDPRGKKYIINKAEILPTRRNPRRSQAQCLTANARTKDGLNASTVLMDEFSQARDRGLLDVLTTSMGVRDNPLTVIITTASDVFDGPFYSMLAGYKSMLLGESEDDSLFVHLFEPDVDDAEDSMETWRKVHPHLGVTVNESFYEEEWRKAQRDGSDAMLAFRTKLLNVYTENQAKTWLAATMIRDNSAPLILENLPQRYPGTIGIDLSVRDDFSAITLGIVDEASFMQYFRTWYFMPRGGLTGHRNEALYRKWAAAGHLIIQDGEVIDYAGIVEHLLYISNYVDIIAICFDPYKSKECVNMVGATEIGGALRPFPQTQGHFTSPVQSFEVGLRTGHIKFHPNPINAFCFGNAVLDTDRNGNMKPYKRNPNDKIDGVITTLMAHQAFAETIRYV